MIPIETTDFSIEKYSVGNIVSRDVYGTLI
jgi:hypothetical protein